MPNLHNTRTQPDSLHRSLVAVLSSLSFEDLAELVSERLAQLNAEAFMAQSYILAANPGLMAELDEASARVREVLGGL